MTTTSTVGSSDLSSLLAQLGTSSSGSSGASGASGSSGSSTGTNLAGLISAAGIGSGLDVDSIVTALVNARKAGEQNQIDNKTTTANAQLVGINALKLALSNLNGAITKLSQATTYSTYAATLSNTSIGTTSTLTSAQPGSYNVVVSQLATAQKRTSDTYGAKDAIGEGTLTIGVGGKNINVAVSATASLADIAAAINGATGNPGVQATVVNGANGSQLLLSSTKTGVANAFTVSANATSSDGLLAFANQLATPATDGTGVAQDAKLTVDGIPATSASNNVSGVLDGVTLNLTATGTSQLTVAQDTSGVAQDVSDFVDAYNDYQTTVDTLESYDPNSKTSGVLLGDSMLNSVKRQVASLINGAVPGNSIGTLANLGIKRDSTGQMSFDSAKLNATLASNPAGVRDLFSGTNGLATKLANVTNTLIAPSGIIATRATALTASLTRLDTQQTALDSRMSTYESMLRTQYTQLDTLMSTLNTTSSYLTKALAGLEATYTKNN
ncbi:flagellar filament capping protein FliD [Pinirhizobacter sp.]|jgi:flagellar hook-associated protein 2|uniref:flagellar filament capping protein FliD n=1 Tax=Pinirhizobacter sp. TaxID=2950432 RepID=UPI002F3E704A